MSKQTKELRGLSVTELNEKLVGLKQELSKEKAVIASGTRSENPGKIKKIRKNIARIFTIINEKEESDARNR